MRFVYVLSLMLAMALVSCASPAPAVKPMEPVIPAVVPQSKSVMDFNIRPGDVLNVRVAGEDDLSGTYIVQTDGTINMPLAGLIHVQNIPTDKAAEIIAQTYRDGYLVNPEVTIENKTSQCDCVRVDVKKAVP